MTTPHDPTTQDLAHFAFCALVALRTAMQDGIVTSPLAEHLFLIRWLATAQKHKRFTRRLAVDIQLLLNKGRRQGEKAFQPNEWAEYPPTEATNMPAIAPQLLQLIRVTEVIPSAINPSSM